MVRYDPTKEEHKVFEMNNKSEEVMVTKKSKKEVKREKEEENKSEEDDNDVNQTKLNENKEEPSRFYEIRDDIKNLFCKNEVFQFKFSNKTDKSSDEEDDEVKRRDSDDERKNFKNYSQIKRSLDYLDDNNYESSLSSEGEENEKPVTLTNGFSKFEKLDPNLDFIPDINEPRLQGKLIIYF